MKPIIILAIMILSTFTHGASRVGGGTLSNDTDKYEMDLAPAFTQAELLPNEVVRLLGPTGITSMRFSAPQLIQIYRFEESNAAASATDRTALVVFFNNNNWQIGNHTDICIDVYSKKTQSAVTYNVVWGNQSGATLVGQNTKLIEASIEQMIKSIRLLPGACSWK